MSASDFNSFEAGFDNEGSRLAEPTKIRTLPGPASTKYRGRIKSNRAKFSRAEKFKEFVDSTLGARFRSAKVQNIRRPILARDPHAGRVYNHLLKPN